MTRNLFRSLTLIAMVACTASAGAAGYPDRPIRFIVPTGSGGPSDLCMRTVAQAMQARLGQTVIVENVTGATGNIGLVRVASAEPDGYTVSVPSAANTANFITRPKLSFDVEGKLKPVGKICVSGLSLVVSPKLGVNTVADLVRYGRDNPGKLTFGSIGSGSSQHLMAEMFAAATGLSLVHVPFRGEAPAAAEIASGRVSMMFMAGAKPFLDGGLVTGVATTNHETWPPIPDLPPIQGTLPELAGFSFNGWNGLMVPQGTPDSVVRKLSDALQYALKDEKTRRVIATMGNVPGAGTPEDLAGQLQSDRKMFQAIIDKRKLSFDE
ncbi:Tripartite tricarboxylate transporter family receptor [Pigmentiphaga humi]|uniref:Tripartite tricarboxylate transporter family receptor n=1 Tax=Pigmentiphaga humi TaxID=2478468 RepID=A0A3P4AX59_9BURK|nr:tripartite tricarboxylate transporter substrate binding protein [Pigmentiphaga humi]VCU68633.1 Tripartite tricarboxylate transporter family receptor [Pigmentiphaga humi]